VEIKNRIREFIITNFVTASGVFIDDTTALLESGIIDSTGVMEMLLFVEEEFDIEVPPEDLLPENFNSIAGLADYIQRKLT